MKALAVVFKLGSLIVGGTSVVRQAKKTRTLKLGSTIALGVASLGFSGCASMRSTDAFGSKTTTESGFASTLSNTTKGITGQFKSMGSAVSSAYSKTKKAVSDRFSSRDPNDDPTSLANMPSPNSLGPEIWVTNGQLYESQGNFTKALDNYTKALELEPNNPAALLSTARLYNRQKDYGQAVEFFNKALAVSPQAGTYNELAVALQSQGMNAEAQSAVKKAIEQDPSNPRYRNNLAGMLVSSGRSDEAVRQLQELFPPAVANYNVAFLHYQNKNLAAAQQHLQSALKADPNLRLAQDLMARLGNSSTAQSALAAYKSAEDIYKTAEATLRGSGIQANQAVYQLPPATGLPAAPQSTMPQSSLPQNFVPPSSLPNGASVTPQAHAAPQGYSAPQAYSAPQGSSTPQGYNPPQGYTLPNGSSATSTPQVTAPMLGLPTVTR